jgi:hypothetical protein
MTDPNPGGNVIPPQYGVPLDASDLKSSIPVSILYGVTPTNQFIPIKLDANGQLLVTSTGPVVPVGLVQVEGRGPGMYIGDVNAAGEFITRARIVDGSNNSIGSLANPLRIDPVGTTTQPVSVSSLPLPTGAATEATLAGIRADLTNLTYDGSNRLIVNGSQVTQPIVGTVTSNIGTTGGLALDSTLTGGTQKVQLTNGSIQVVVTAANALKVDGSAVTQPVSGTFFQAVQPVNGTVTADIGTTNGLALDSSLATIITKTNQLTFTSTRLLVDGSGVTQPISGNVAATQSGTWNINNITGTITLPTGAATQLTLSQIKTDTDNLDVLLSSRATQVTAAQIATNTTNIGTPLQDSKIANTIPQQPVTNEPRIAIQLDNVGLGKDATLQSILTDVAKFTFASTRLIVDGSQVTQPVSGTLTVNQGTSPWITSAAQSGTWNINNITGTITLPTGASTSANQINGSQKSQIVDGAGNVVTSTAVGGQRALDVNIAAGVTLNVNLDHTTDNVLIYGNDGTTDRKILTSTTGQLEIDSISGTISLPTGASTEATQLLVKADLDKFTFAATRLLVDGSGVTQPVSGTIAATQSGNWSVRTQDGLGNLLTTQASGAQRALDVGIDVAGVQIDPRQIRLLTSTDVVTANIGTTGGLALDATLTGGTQKTKILDGSGNALTSTVVGAAQALDVNVTQNVVPTSGTATASTVAGNAASVQLLASNTSRKMAMIFNDSTHNNAILYIAFGVAASATVFVTQIAAGGYYELPLPIYTGAINGIWIGSATANARITELT